MSSRRPLNVLVTGGSGFVGTAVVAELLDRGHQVVSTSNVLSDSLPDRPGLSWVLWDALGEPVPDVEWRAFQAVLHLAAPVGHLDFPAQAWPVFELAVAATFRLLEKAREHGIGRVLVASTGNVLAPGDGLAAETDIHYEPETFYGAAKACSELLVRSYQSELSSAVLRFFHPYGLGGERFVISRLIRSVAAGREIRIEGQNGILLNPVWIEDLAVGVCLAVESDATGVFHFAGPDVLNLRELVELIGALLDKPPVITTRRQEHLVHHAGSYEVAQRVLGYNPQVSLREGLGRLIAHMDQS